MASSKPPVDAKHEPTTFVGGAAEPLGPDDYSMVLEVEQQEPYLLAYGGPGKGLQTPLRSRTVIGRDPMADITLDSPSVSRRHALVLEENDRFVLRDLGSANGTFFEGLLVGESQPLVDGDRFRVGETDFQFCDPPHATRRR